MITLDIIQKSRKTFEKLMKPWRAYQSAISTEGENSSWSEEKLQALAYEEAMTKEPADWLDVSLKIVSKVSLLTTFTLIFFNPNEVT